MINFFCSSEKLDFLSARKFCQDQGKDIAVASNLKNFEVMWRLVHEKVEADLEGVVALACMHIYKIII